MRDAVNSQLEALRKSKVIGTSLEAVVHLTVNGELGTLLEHYRDDLPTLFITSEVTLTQGAPAAGEADSLFSYQDAAGSARIEVGRLDNTKCPRCWRWVCPPHSDEPNVASTAVCARCADALANAPAPVA